MNHAGSRCRSVALSLIGFAAALHCPLLSAAAIVEVGPPTSAPRAAVSPAAIGAVSFTTTATYQNVQISAWLSQFDNEDLTTTVSAFLVDQIGDGTTALANEIASSTTNVFLPPYSTAADIVQVQLLSIPTLLPGTYYLVLNDPENFVYWGEGGPTTTASGVTLNNNFLQVGVLAGYAPATDMPLCAFCSFSYLVTGDPLTTNGEVPEPNTVMLLATGIMGMITIRFRR